MSMNISYSSPMGSLISFKIHSISNRAGEMSVKVSLFMIVSFGSTAWCSNDNRLSGKNLTIVASPWKPFLMWKCPNDQDWTEDWETDCPNGDRRMYSGIMWELLIFMRQARNFSFSIISTGDHEWGGTCHNDNNCTGMIGSVNRGEADFALGKNMKVVNCQEQILEK